MSRLARPAVLLPLAALLLFAGGVVYAVTKGLNSSAVAENESTLADAGALPGSREVGRQSETFSGGDSLPVPKGVVTTVAYTPPAGTGQNAVVNYYAERLRPGWAARVERSLAGAAGTTDERSFRVTFSRGERCLVLGTAGMTAALERPVYTLSAYKRSGERC
ncbi:MAG: hypothetical protein ABI649_02650 [Gaiellaceae bacterium]